MKYIELVNGTNNCKGCAFEYDEHSSECYHERNTFRGAKHKCSEHHSIWLEDTPENRVRVVTERLKS